MAIKMRNECCADSSTLDLDQVLRDLQTCVPAIIDFKRIGPFGVLPLATAQETCKSNDDAVDEETSREDIVDDRQPESYAEIKSPLLIMDLNPWDDLDEWDLMEQSSAVIGNADQCLENSDFFQQALLPFDQVSSDQPEQEIMPGILDMVEFSDHPKSALDVGPPMNVQPAHGLSIITMPNDANMCKIPVEARTLLDYYSRRVIEVMSIAPTKQPPWETIHLPCAMSALAEIMVHGETKSFAKMSLFHALLSVSSYHIGLANSHLKDMSQYWCDKGAFHKHNAATFLRAALTKGLPKSSRGKYKEILMSFLSMVTIGVCISF